MKAWTWSLSTNMHFEWKISKFIWGVEWGLFARLRHRHLQREMNKNLTERWLDAADEEAAMTAEHLCSSLWLSTLSCTSEEHRQYLSQSKLHHRLLISHTHLKCWLHCFLVQSKWRQEHRGSDLQHANNGIVGEERDGGSRRPRCLIVVFYCVICHLSLLCDHCRVVEWTINCHRGLIEPNA